MSLRVFSNPTTHPKPLLYFNHLPTREGHEGSERVLSLQHQANNATVGLSQLRARYYDPQIGRFVSEDPIGFGGGVNFFRYALNSPTLECAPESADLVSSFAVSSKLEERLKRLKVWINDARRVPTLEITVELEQSPYLNVVSQTRVRETLRLMGRSPDETVTDELGRELCQRVSAKAVLWGSNSMWSYLYRCCVADSGLMPALAPP